MCTGCAASTTQLVSGAASGTAMATALGFTLMVGIGLRLFLAGAQRTLAGQTERVRNSRSLQIALAATAIALLTILVFSVS